MTSENICYLNEQTKTNYWVMKLDDFKIIRFPTEKPSFENQNKKKDRAQIIIDNVLFEELKKFSNNNNVTLYVTLLTGLYILINRFCNQSDITIATPIITSPQGQSNRLDSLGFNILPLRVNTEGHNVKSLLKSVSQACREAYLHKDFNLKNILKALNHVDTSSTTTLFPLIFILQDEIVFQHLSKDELRKMFEILFDIDTDKLDMMVILEKDPKQLLGYIEFNTNLYSLTTINQIVVYYQDVLRTIYLYPERNLIEFLRLSTEDLPEVIKNCNQTILEFDNKNVISLFEKQVLTNPNKIAIIYENGKITYKELNRRANQLANFIRTKYKTLYLKELKKDTIMGLCTERSIEMIVGLLAILKTGAAYLPLDPLYPKDRLVYMINETQAPIILTQDKFLPLFSNNNFNVVSLDNSTKDTSIQKKENLNVDIQSNNIAYVLFTSGTTGTPKGVITQHASFGNFINAAVEEYGLDTNDSILQFASISFGAAVEEIYPCLVIGATLVIATEEMRGSFSNLLMKCQSHNITILDLPTSYWHQLVSYISERTIKPPPSIRLVILGGEKLDVEKLKLWQQSVGNYPRLVNTYGCTEGTVVTTKYDIPEVNWNKAENINIPIGRPIYNCNVYILDQDNLLVPYLIPGEICIGGEGIAKEYLNNPELTTKKFICNPYNNNNSRLYKTGDVGRWLPDGNIELLGRIDHQVKIRNFRIEIGEIESVLSKYPLVKEQIVIINKDQATDTERIIAYIVYDKKLENNYDECEVKLRIHLNTLLPEYMIPSLFIFLDSMPLNQNGKIDRKALPQPNIDLIVSDKYIAPKNRTEEILLNIWRLVLKVGKISINNNFFSVGGHSLLSIHLLSEINENFNKNLAVSWIFQYPTIEKQATYLLENIDQIYNPICTFNSEGICPPLFFIHPGGVSTEIYSGLAEKLDKSIPFFGVESYNIYSNGNYIDSLENLVDYYIKEIKKIKPSGPYCLGGWSFGGIVAYEMARQLVLRGERVISVYLIDTSVFSNVEKEINKQLGDIITRIEVAMHPFPLHKQYHKKISKVNELENEMYNKYSYPTYDGKLFLFNAVLPKKLSFKINDDEEKIYNHYLKNFTKKKYKGWGEIVPNLKEIKIKADHFSIMNKNNLKKIANVIKADMNENNLKKVDNK